MVHEPVLRIEDVTKQYRAGKRVLEEISMTFHPGSAIVLKGANGSGKTTFLRLLSGNSYPTSGKIFYGDIDIHRHPFLYLSHVGLVHDEEGLPLFVTAVELLQWLMKSRKKWDETSEKRIHNLFDQLELDEARHEEIGTYSTGMKKKAQIAAALCTEPDLLLLDEPLRGLDLSSREKALGLFSKAVERGAIVLMATHSDSDKEDIFGKRIDFPLGKADL